MHQFKFNQAQAKHLSPEELEHYADLGLIKGIGPHMSEVVCRHANSVSDLRAELDDAEDKLEKFPAECPSCGADIPQ